MKGFLAVFNSGTKDKSKSRNTLDAINSNGERGDHKMFQTEPNDIKFKNKIPKHSRN
jgi:hypothetical protein